jgi:hypothetical protein
MIRILITTLAVWVLLLSPGLCLAGALEHLCEDCPEDITDITCEHEEDCTADPCGEVLLRPDTASIISALAPVAVLPTGLITPESSILDPRPLLKASPLSSGKNLPRPQSDLPLLI